MASGKLLFCPAAGRRNAKHRRKAARTWGSAVNLLSGKRPETAGGKHLHTGAERAQLYAAGRCGLSGSIVRTVLCDKRRGCRAIWQRGGLQDCGAYLLRSHLCVLWHRTTASEMSIASPKQKKRYCLYNMTGNAPEQPSQAEVKHLNVLVIRPAV